MNDDNNNKQRLLRSEWRRRRQIPGEQRCNWMRAFSCTIDAAHPACKLLFASPMGTVSNGSEGNKLRQGEQRGMDLFGIAA